MSSGYCNGYGSYDQYRCGPEICTITYWNQEDTVATAAVTPLIPQSVMLLNSQNGEFVQPMMAATNAQSSYSNIRQIFPPFTAREASLIQHQPYQHQYHRSRRSLTTIPQSNLNPPTYQPHSVNKTQQYQISNDSPQNFQVPSNSTTQNSNESYLFEGNTLTDISSSQNSCQKNAVPVAHPINKSLEDINMDEMVQILDECNWNPNLTIDSPLVYETYEISPAADKQAIINHQRNAIGNDNVATFYPQNVGRYLEGVNVTDTFPSDTSAEISSASRTDMEEDEDEESEEESLTDSDSPKRIEKRGRKRIYNKKQRQERRKKTVIQSYHRCAERNAAYRQSLIEEVKKLERENNELLQNFGRLMNRSENLANFMPEDDKNYARKYIQTVKTNVEKVKKNCK